MNRERKLITLLTKYYDLEIDKQIDYKKFYLYSLITHSTAIEGSTLSEIDTQLLFDEGIAAKGCPIGEQLMNLDLKLAYEQSILFAKNNTDISIEMLCKLSSLVMKNTGGKYNTALGEFSSANGDLRLINVTAGLGGPSYLNHSKVSIELTKLCESINQRRRAIVKTNTLETYRLSFDFHYLLVTIHPWADGNGRMARLMMNQIQFEFGLTPTIIHKDTKSEYIKALVDTRESDDLLVFQNFMFDEHIRNLEKIISNYESSMEYEPVTKFLKDSANDGLNDGLKGLNDGLNLTERQLTILEFIKQNPNIKLDKIANLLDLSKPSIEREISYLKSKNILQRIGSKKSGVWVVN